MALKDEPWRLLPSSYARRFSTRILFSDMDAFRHLNNGATGRYFEEGRADLNIQIFGVRHMINAPDGWQLLFANVTIDYIREAHYPGAVEIASGVRSIGRSSYVVSQAAFQQDQCFAVAEAVLVKARQGQSQQLLEAEREALEGLRCTAAEEYP
ncbi:thioesterase family protein [Sphingobium sp. EM0848]|uniref:acyl-CoA thioesterase n=1 Tax=Sphingobium sp. EM0848 TaxID=2743473 RepID=UPI00159CAA3E|nr:acyl-CoA thioesterase [Sphingobium sp. EM0848]